MGRRSLPKLDPTLDLSRHLQVFEPWPENWQPESRFARPAPLEIEVGSGKGLFMAAAATAEPEKNFIGIEIAERYARYAASRLKKRGLENAYMVAANAERVFQELISAASLAAVHVYFPDPWWKARHRRRRVMNESFVRNVERVLLPGGKLHFWTDVEEYYEATLELLRAVTTLNGPHAVPERPADHDFDYRTNYERRTRIHGAPVYRSEFRKPEREDREPGAKSPSLQ
ncbi:MAG TPA: tRNA (guanosine(46)-N7)-methyltransferase TrmB [Pirellulales bacterium]|jgi:tRNA (guanine-N7-)-methyltransferase|nr:tRNA (guanosine(46)-N7)-methyltransferase TrmB [Pirellulales bacterium]